MGAGALEKTIWGGPDMTGRIAMLLITWVFIGGMPASNDYIAADINERILKEESEDSQVMRIAYTLTDVYGPRLTGSPNFKAACDWILGEMEEWRLSNPHLEEWNFGHAGWENEKSFVRVISPYNESLQCEVVAWTPGTEGRIQAQVVQIIPPEDPSAETLARFLDRVREKIRHKIVLVGEPKPVTISSSLPRKRLEDNEVWKYSDPVNPDPCLDRTSELSGNESKTLNSWEVDERLDSFFVANDVLAKVTDAARDGGQIPVLGTRVQDVRRSVTGLVLRREDFGRIARTLTDGRIVKMELEITNATYPGGKTSYNVIAEIAGTDKKDEVVMLGGHLDSWHGATGATDNAAGVSVTMEAIRILKELGVQPRRTIRIALWGGEEQGLLGSQAYVEDHFGNYENQRQEFSKFVAYLNLDSGSGLVRGAVVFGPPEAAAFIREILAPFKKLGVVGAIASSSRMQGNTDSASFSWAGLAGIDLRQDPLDYVTHTLHTNLDTYEHLSESDLKQCATVAAALTYHLATKEQSLPRFSRGTMPEPGTNPDCK